MIAIPINNDCQYQRRKAHSLDNSDQRVVTEVPHDRTVHTKAYEQGDCDQGRGDEEPWMHTDWIDHFVDPQTHNESHPER
jgi:hypothetical protein